MKRSVGPLVFFALLGLACSPASVGPADAGPSSDKACSDSAYARCTRLQACSPTEVQLRYGDLGTCESVSTAYCMNNLAAPSTGATPSSIEACVQAIPNWDCGDYMLSQNVPPECQTTPGGLPAGAACAFPGQCQSAFCAIVPGAGCGTCAPVPQPGDGCLELASCGLTLACDGTPPTCLAPAQPMAVCIPGQSCTVGNECVGENSATGASGTCKLAVETAGAACSPTVGECDFFAGLTCNTMTMQCVAAQFGGAGQPCNYVASANVTMFCAAGGKCIAATPGAQGTCSGSSTIGGPCDLAVGPTCVTPSRCIVGSEGGTGGTCQVPDGTMCQ
jgi:hypothetical protein